MPHASWQGSMGCLVTLPNENVGVGAIPLGSGQPRGPNAPRWEGAQQASRAVGTEAGPGWLLLSGGGGPSELLPESGCS